MAESPPKRNVFTVPPGAAFVDALVAGVIRDCPDPLGLSDVTLLLPNRRAVRAITDAFLRHRDGAPTLLPRLRPIGDVEQDDPDLLGDEVASEADDAELPPAIAEPRRLALLARLIMARPDQRVAADQALLLARELARLLDQAHTERCAFDRLAELAPADFARHWQVTLDFLKIVTEHWPRVLEDEFRLDPARRRDLLMGRLAERWRAEPPGGRVLIAGSTGSVKATADLMQVVAGLPNGAVILPGLDRAALAADGPAILDDPTHPQHTMARLLALLEVAASDVPDWPEGIAAMRPVRAALLSAALRPAEATDAWRDLPPFDAQAVANVWRLDCPSPREEAAAIALMLRETLEQPGKTAALVTPDRALARRVAVELKRWDIAIDDSAGMALADTPPGVFLRLAAAMIAEECAPFALLAGFKHPLCSGGRAREEFRALTRRLESAILRGPRPAPGLAGLVELARALEDDTGLLAWLRGIETAARTFAALAGAAEASLAALVAAHWSFASFLSTDADGVCALGVGEAGEALARALDEINEAAADFPAVRGIDYPALFAELLRGRVVRPRRGQHPRLAIWGLLEARLQQADRLILGGLNEGVWPGEPPIDPWMSRPMRAKFGLPPPERRVGLSAHDFAQGFLAPEVILTRATRVDGTPTVPSRWLMRLDAVLRAGGESRTLPAGPWLDWQELLDRPALIAPVARPAPCPPVAARPRRLSVTRVETWMRDPYAIYARYVLGLKPLDPIDALPGAADRGTLIHDALDRFLRAFPGHLPEDALERLLAIGREAFRPVAARPGVLAFWWPRFQRSASWFVDRERTRRLTVAESFAEVEGRIAIDGPAGPFLLTAKVDRIDRLEPEGIVIIDYKTGAPPSPAHVNLGFSPQLPLEAAIAAAGGFTGVPAAPIESLEIWRLSGGPVPGEIKPIKGDIEALWRAALDGVKRLVAVYDDPLTPYASVPRAAFAPRFSDYEHLARVQEWSVAGGEE